MLSFYGFAIKPGRPSCGLVIEMHFRWQCKVETDRVECDPNSVISTLSCWGVDTHHLNRTSVEIGLCCFARVTYEE